PSIIVPVTMAAVIVGSILAYGLIASQRGFWDGNGGRNAAGAHPNSASQASTNTITIDRKANHGHNVQHPKADKSPMQQRHFVEQRIQPATEPDEIPSLLKASLTSAAKMSLTSTAETSLGLEPFVHNNNQYPEGTKSSGAAGAHVSVHHVVNHNHGGS